MGVLLYVANFLALSWWLSWKSLISSNTGKFLWTMPCEGVLCIIVQNLSILCTFWHTSNIGKYLQYFPCEGVCYIIVLEQFWRVDYKICLHRFLSFRTRTPHVDFVTVPTRSCYTYMLRIFLMNSDSRTLYYTYPFLNDWKFFHRKTKIKFHLRTG